MLIEAKDKASKYHKNIQLIQMHIEKLEVKTDAFDVIVASFVFCSVPDPIKELKRVLKHHGRIIMLEHMRSKNLL